jgi:serine/threonine protein phosphatase PrpC
LVIGSDGVWETMETIEIVKFIKLNLEKKKLQVIVEELL